MGVSLLLVPLLGLFIRELFPLQIYHVVILFPLLKDEIHRKSEKDMTEAELKQREVDREYFHSNRDKNKDGVLDKVIS